MTSKGESSHRGGKYCVAGKPNNVSCTNGQHTKEVSIHHFPNATKEPKRHTKWVKFVGKHRPGWNPSETSLCSSHFEDSCFEQNRIIAASLGIKDIYSWGIGKFSPLLFLVNLEYTCFYCFGDQVRVIPKSMPEVIAK
ncbi:THAP domain-containing 2-like, partial [Paramuricea clavata]